MQRLYKKIMITNILLLIFIPAFMITAIANSLNGWNLMLKEQIYLLSIPLTVLVELLFYLGAAKSKKITVYPESILLKIRDNKIMLASFLSIINFAIIGNIAYLLNLSYCFNCFSNITLKSLKNKEEGTLLVIFFLSLIHICLYKIVKVEHNSNHEN